MDARLAGSLTETAIPRITAKSVVVASPDQVSADIGGETAILHLKDDRYFGLDAVGARVWALIRRPREVAAVRDALLAEFEVEPERCEAELVALLEQMAAAGLVVVR